MRSFEIEHKQSVYLHDTKNVGNVKDQFAILDSDGAILICHAIPGHTSDPQPCKMFSTSGLASNTSLDTCSEVLAWPAQMYVFSFLIAAWFISSCGSVYQAQRESVAMTVFQTWLFGISVIAIIAESTPHVSVHPYNSIAFLC